MADKFLTAYQQWPSDEQMKFAIVALLIVSTIVFCFAWWLVKLTQEFMFYCSVWWRGWPEYQEHVGHLLPGTPDRPEAPEGHPLATLRQLASTARGYASSFFPPKDEMEPAEAEPGLAVASGTSNGHGHGKKNKP